MNILSIIVAIFVFGLLIFIHEMGHFLVARACHVTVLEFAVGMGPKLFSWVGKKSGTRYSLRALPFGGFTSMAGEDDDESDDPNSLDKKPLWQRFLITAAGSLSNLCIGIILMTVLVICTKTLGSTTVYGFIELDDGSPALSQSSGLRENDRILKIDGESVHTANELAYEVMRRGIEPISVTVERDGETVVLENVRFPLSSSEGIAFGALDFKVYAEHRTFPNIVKHAYFRSELTVEMIWESLFDLVTGRYGIEAVSGPVGVTEVLGEAAASGFSDLIYIAVVLSMNLGIMNLLPLPALDGGRLLFMLVELIRGKRVDAKFEAAVHFFGIIILLGIMVLVTLKDIVKLF